MFFSFFRKDKGVLRYLMLQCVDVWVSDFERPPWLSALMALVLPWCGFWLI